MLYINKGEVNTLYLNINNNARPEFDTYTLDFVHVMSKEEKTYVIETNNPAEYFQNIRYCTITLDLVTDDLNYEGQYILNIVGSGGNSNAPMNVYNGMAVLQDVTEANPFTEYISPNEDNSNYIYIQD
jgi:hypothetical protein